MRTESLSSVEGPRIGPDHPEYDQARAAYVGSIVRRPAVIVRAANVDDVRRVVSHARETGTELAVRAGGHSLAGHGVCDGGTVLDLSRLRGIEIDPATRTAWVEAGATAGEYTSATGAHGLATGFGDSGTVGVAGITLGGGIGLLVRKHGLTIDDLLAAEVVTADGRVARTDAETEPELFWAIRGGGGNFGVVTRFRFRLQPLPSIVGGMLMLPATPDVIASFVAEADSAPEELSTVAAVMVAPPMPMIPAGHQGRPVLMVMLVYAGETAAGERLVARLRSLATPIADRVRPIPYHEIYALTAGAPHPHALSFRTLFADEFTVRTAGTILEHLEAGSAPMRSVQIRMLGGAMARVPADATAFAHRSRRMLMNVAAIHERPDEAPTHDAWVERLTAALRGAPGVYVGFLGAEGNERVREAYPSPTWERLRAIKLRYDPGNLFHHNQNIPPASG